MQNHIKIVLIGGIFIILIVIGAFFLFLSETDDREIKDAPEILIPARISAIGEQDFDQDRIYYRDYSNMLHGIFMFGGNSRSSELGNERYMPELSGYDMQDRGARWLRLVQVTDNFFNDDGRLISHFEKAGEGRWVSSDEIDLADYPHGVYSYHMHHRGDRWADHGLEDQIIRIPSRYITTPGKFLLDKCYSNGYFLHADSTYDHKSMSYGLGGIHGHAYAWVRWAKPDGAEDMGMLEESRLTQFLGYSKEELTALSREIAGTLKSHWDEESGIYDFDDGTTWRTDAVGAMLRGQKSVYDLLYMFGDENDKVLAREIFEHSVVIVENVLPAVRPWGLPEEITFTPDGVKAASDTVNLYDWYQFLNHLGGGYAWMRESEGTSRFLSRYHSDLISRVNEMTDQAIEGAMQHHFRNGRLATSVRYEDGSVIDERNNASAIGMFITMAGNLYTNGGRFARAADWDDVPAEVADRTRSLYNFKLAHIVLLERQFLFDAASPRRQAAPQN